MLNLGSMKPTGGVSMSAVRALPMPVAGLRGQWTMFVRGLPRLGLTAEVFAWRVRNLPNLWRGAWRVMLASILGLPTIAGVLTLRAIRADGTVVDYGTASFRLVTNAGRDYIVDAFQNITEVENFKFHGIGTGTNAEAAGDTALQTELTTQYNPNDTRATGSQTENGSSVYRTVGTNPVDATVAITEHGIFTSATGGAGTLLDRSQFSAINLGNGDSLQSTYDLTINSGG